MQIEEAQRVLGVGAPEETDEYRAALRSAWKEAARKLHPDTNKEPDAAKRFQEAKEAYETLTEAAWGRLPPPEPDDEVEDEIEQVIALLLVGMTQIQATMRELAVQQEVLREFMQDVIEETQDIRAEVDHVRANVDLRVRAVMQAVDRRFQVAAATPPVASASPVVGRSRPKPPKPAPKTPAPPVDLGPLDAITDLLRRRKREKRG